MILKFVNIYRYRKHTISDSFKIFQKEHPDIKCGRTSFFNHKPKWIKKPCSQFDVCPICKEIKQNMKYLESKHGKSLSIEEIQALEAMNFHKDIIEKRQKEYDDAIDKLEEGKAIITIDFKANISLGQGNEVSLLYFSIIITMNLCNYTDKF